MVVSFAMNTKDAKERNKKIHAKGTGLIAAQRPCILGEGSPQPQSSAALQTKLNKTRSMNHAMEKKPAALPPRNSVFERRFVHFMK